MRMIHRTLLLVPSLLVLAGLYGCGPEEETCHYGGETYSAGDSFPSTDGCNSCRCGADGTVACTLRACVDGGIRPSSCEDVRRAFEAELESIQSCDSDAQCGQVLTGTSCGCTRNLVARTDADASRLRQLLETEIDGQRCVSLGSTCDCPAADGFACNDGRCAWNHTR